MNLCSKLLFFLLVLTAPFLAFADAKTDAAKWVDYAARQYQAKQYDQAIASYTNALKLDPRNDRAYQGLGNCFLGKGDKAKALTYYKYALQVNPGNSSLKQYVDSMAASVPAPAGGNDAAGLMAQGNQAMTAKQYDAAVAAFGQSAQLDPNNPKVFQALGNAFYYQGKKPEAIAAWDRAVSLDPSNTSLKTYVDSLRGSAQTAGGAEIKNPSYMPYVMIPLVAGLGAIMLFLF